MSDERFERHYYGHGRGVVVTQPESGKFVERPMTTAELAAREPALKIADQIHELASRAAFAYIKAWEIIAPAIEASRLASRESGWKEAIEACAQVCEALGDKAEAEFAEHSPKHVGTASRVVCRQDFDACAAAIRALKVTK